MADEAEDDALILEDVVKDEDLGDETQGAATETDEPGEEGEEEAVVTFGDEAAPASEMRDTELVKHLRAEIRERDKALAEARKAAPQAQVIEVGEKPTLESCDYDEAVFDREYEAWQGRKAEAKRAETEAGKAQREAQEAWQNELAGYQAKKSALTFPDVQEVEDAATAVLDQVQQAVIVKAADNPALVLYSLGKHPAKLAEISKIKDPIKMAAAVVKLEGVLKVTTKRKAPEPEEIARGSASMASGDAKLDGLLAKARKSGDYSAYFEAKRGRQG